MREPEIKINPAAGFNRLMLNSRWPWHILFWTGYILFRLWGYYLTVKFYDRVYLEYMLIAEAGLVFLTYFTLWLYERLFTKNKYFVYFSAATLVWVLYLYCRTLFQFAYLHNEPGFQGAVFSDVFISNLAFVAVYFLFVTACKYFKDDYILRQKETENKQQQLMAEVNNLKAQIAPHFLFNTLNNLYGLAVDKSEKLPGLMLRLSDLLRHSLYETQKPFVSLADEISTLKSYVKLESIRLEDDLKLQFNDSVPAATEYVIAPLLLIVFAENAFKHAKLVHQEPVVIEITTLLDAGRFSLQVKNNFNEDKAAAPYGIGLANVKKRLALLYPGSKHDLVIDKDANYFTVRLTLELSKKESDGN